MLPVLPVLAENGSGQMMITLMYFIGPLFLLYFFLLRPQLREQKQRQALASSLEKNDRILTIGGIYGTVVSVSDKEDEVTIRVDDNCKLKMVRSSILRNITKEEQMKTAKGEVTQKEAGSK